MITKALNDFFISVPDIPQNMFILGIKIIKSNEKNIPMFVFFIVVFFLVRN